MFLRHFVLGSRPHFANQNIIINSPTENIFSRSALVMGHLLASFLEQYHGTALLRSLDDASWLKMVWADWSKGWALQARCLCPLPYLSFKSQLPLDSELNNDLNQEIIIKRTIQRHTPPSAFYERLERKWVSHAQHGGPNNGDCHLASSKTLLLMAMFPPQT